MRPAFVGSLFGLSGVVLGAFGAHALKARISVDMLAVYQTGVQYHLVHAVALLAIGGLAPTTMEPNRIALSARLFSAGILIFSGSLYVLALTGERWLGAITPLGGVCFLAGWTLLALSLAPRRVDVQ